MQKQPHPAPHAAFTRSNRSLAENATNRHAVHEDLSTANHIERLWGSSRYLGAMYLVCNLLKWSSDCELFSYEAGGF